MGKKGNPITSDVRKGGIQFSTQKFWPERKDDSWTKLIHGEELYSL